VVTKAVLTVYKEASSFVGDVYVPALWQHAPLNGDNMLQKDKYLIANIPDYTFGLIYCLQYVNIYMVSYLCSTAATI
jgi:hypothetical protein